MVVRLESTPISSLPFEALFDRGGLFPDLKWPGISQTTVYPHVNIADMKDTLHVVAEVPGVPKSDIAIHLADNVLTISGERKPVEMPKGGTSVRQEITYGTFKRSFTLPYEVDGSQVTAEYRDGVLHIVLPKSETAKPTSIVIQ